MFVQPATEKPVFCLPSQRNLILCPQFFFRLTSELCSLSVVNIPIQNPALVFICSFRLVSFRLSYTLLGLFSLASVVWSPPSSSPPRFYRVVFIEAQAPVVSSFHVNGVDFPPFAFFIVADFAYPFLGSAPIPPIIPFVSWRPFKAVNPLSLAGDFFFRPSFVLFFPSLLDIRIFPFVPRHTIWNWPSSDLEIFPWMK